MDTPHWCFRVSKRGRSSRSRFSSARMALSGHQELAGELVSLPFLEAGEAGFAVHDHVAEFVREAEPEPVGGRVRVDQEQRRVPVDPLGDRVQLSRAQVADQH